MAITDNNFTPEELGAALDANPDLLNHVTGTLTGRKFFVADEATKATYDTNLATRTRSELTSQHATEVEKKVEEITGIKKSAPDEKWTSYYERVLKHQTEQAKTLDTQIKLLEGKSDISAEERRQLGELRLKQTENENLLTKKDSDHQSQIQKLKAENKIYSEIGKIDAKLKKDIDPELLGIKREKVLADMIANSKFDNDRLVFLKEDGKTFYTNPSDASFMTAEQVYAMHMDKFIEKAPIKTGAGGNGEGNADPIAPGQFKTKQEVDMYLSKTGLLQGTKEFSEAQKKYGYAKLPLM